MAEKPKVTRAVKKDAKLRVAVKAAKVNKAINDHRAAGGNTMTEGLMKKVENRNSATRVAGKLGVKNAVNMIEKGNKASNKPGGIAKLESKSQKATAKVAKQGQKAKVKAQTAAAKTYAKPYKGK
jgi:hypothetical protein